MKKLIIIALSIVALSPALVFAQSYTADEISASMSTVLDTSVDSVVDVLLAFFTNNFPLIVILGVSVGLVFWLVRKAVRATRGKA